MSFESKISLTVCRVFLSLRASELFEPPKEVGLIQLWSHEGQDYKFCSPLERTLYL